MGSHSLRSELMQKMIKPDNHNTTTLLCKPLCLVDKHVDFLKLHSSPILLAKGLGSGRLFKIRTLTIALLEVGEGCQQFSKVLSGRYHANPPFQAWSP
jgi:hypothetical protein